MLLCTSKVFGLKIIYELDHWTLGPFNYFWNIFWTIFGPFLDHFWTMFWTMFCTFFGPFLAPFFKPTATNNICEAVIIITFPGKHTIIKHDMDKFNLTQFECRIQNLINLLVNRKQLNVFFLLLSL